VTQAQHHQIVIVGTGFAGVGMAIKLLDAGMSDFVLLEKADDLGGTWRDNTYPGCRCDVPSHLYSYSFEPNPNWSRAFSPQPEIWDYIRRCSTKYGVDPHIRYGHEVLSAGWDDEAQLWRIATSQGDLTADVVVSGMGALHAPSVPDLPGMESFEGTSFHSAHWDHDHDLTGKRVAVIGTGASAIQFVPKIQPKVAQLNLFQRTPPWIMPLPDRELTQRERRIYRRLPGAQLAMRAAIYWSRELLVLGFMHPKVNEIAGKTRALKHMADHVSDPELRRKLTPDYTMGCKRILISDDYYPALGQPNVDVVTDGIREVRARSIVDSNGVEREVDTIVFGTGFHVTDMPAAKIVRGRDGRTLAEAFEGSPKAHRGTTFAGFPNLFMMVGPNTTLGHSSMVFMIESQINYVMSALQMMRRDGVAALEPTADAQAAWNASIDERLEGTVWNAGGCRSWYLDETGRNSTLWPGFTWPFREATRRFDPTEYVLRSPVRARRAPAPLPA
jgi:cation diffusion facilitator CzcD-associated flavoprotein CzcO